jgi:hypothetical protein
LLFRGVRQQSEHRRDRQRIAARLAFARKDSVGFGTGILPDSAVLKFAQAPIAASGGMR